MMNSKIVKILDEYTVIINAGTNKEIEIGDQFQILDNTGSEVLDPDTGEVLGNLDLIKETVTVTEVHEKMCFCSSPVITSVSNSIFSSIQSISESLPVSTRRVKLNIDLKEVTGGLRKSDAPIRIGDSVKLIKASTKQTKP